MTRFEKWSIWTTTFLTAATGIGYFWMKYLMEAAEPWAVINHPLQPWLLKAHILVSPFLIFAVGLITSRHILVHFRSGVKPGRRTGLVLGLIFVPMVLTGYLYQVITHEMLLRIVGYGHFGLGLIYSIGAVFHRPTRQRAPAARKASPRRGQRVARSRSLTP